MLLLLLFAFFGSKDFLKKAHSFFGPDVFHKFVVDLCFFSFSFLVCLFYFVIFLTNLSVDAASFSPELKQLFGEKAIEAASTKIRRRTAICGIPKENKQTNKQTWLN